MFGIFKRKLEQPDQQASRDAADAVVDKVQQSAEEVRRLLRRARQKEMLRGALNGDSD